MTFQEDLSPLSNGEEAANNLNQTLATEPKGISPELRGLNYDLGVATVLYTFNQITMAKKNGEFICFREWLQREEQTKKWTASKKRAARSYLQSVFQTLGVTEEFLLCDINFLIRDIEKQKKSQPKLKRLWDKMLKWLKKHKDLGAKYVILDGQNRINHALVPFRYDGLGIPLKVNGQEYGDLKYNELDDFTRQQVNERKFRVSIIRGGDVTKVVDKLININDGEPWGDHERRDVLWTCVSFDIKEIAAHPKTLSLHQKTLKSKWTGSYAIEKKGITLFIAEMLHFLRNGDKGSSSSLTDMYGASDEKIDKQLYYLNELFKFVASNFPKELVSKNFTKETYRNLLIYMMMLTNPDEVTRGKNLIHNFKFSQINNPKLLLKRIIESHNRKFGNREDIVPFKRKTNVSLTHEQAYQMEKDGRGGEVVWSNTNAKPGSYTAHHSGSSKNDLEARQNLFSSDLNLIIEECLKDSTLVTTDARSITSNDRLVAELKYMESDDCYEEEDLKNVIDKELDHDISVKLGGDASFENLNFIPKEDNRRKGAK